MSASAAMLTQEEYDERRSFLEELKTLAKIEQEEIFRILKASRAEFSENCNGVFFDVCKVPAEFFQQMKKFLDFCHKNRDEFAAREEDERRAQEALRA